MFFSITILFWLHEKKNWFTFLGQNQRQKICFSYKKLRQKFETKTPSHNFVKILRQNLTWNSTNPTLLSFFYFAVNFEIWHGKLSISDFIDTFLSPYISDDYFWDNSISISNFFEMERQIFWLSEMNFSISDMWFSYSVWLNKTYLKTNLSWICPYCNT